MTILTGRHLSVPRDVSSVRMVTSSAFSTCLAQHRRRSISTCWGPERGRGPPSGTLPKDPCGSQLSDRSPLIYEKGGVSATGTSRHPQFPPGDAQGSEHPPCPLPLGTDIVPMAPRRLGQLGPRTPAWALLPPSLRLDIFPAFPPITASVPEGSIPLFHDKLFPSSTQTPRAPCLSRISRPLNTESNHKKDSPSSSVHVCVQCRHASVRVCTHTCTCAHSGSTLVPHVKVWVRGCVHARNPTSVK